MSLIGPRPLLPEDQPTNPTTRLLVRPGITGWAQINGGKALSPGEKDQFDEYYIRNASLLFDLWIALLTLKVLFRINSKSDHKVAASFERKRQSERLEHAPSSALSPRQMFEADPSTVANDDVAVAGVTLRSQHPNG